MDIDPEEIARNTPVSIGIEGDAKAGLAALADLVEREGRSGHRGQLIAEAEARRGRASARRWPAGRLRAGHPRGAVR